MQWSKQLLNLNQERDVILDRIKAHLLGRDETGAVNEPEVYWDTNAEVEYEGYFKDIISPWTVEDLQFKCEDCDVNNEEVSAREEESERIDLCDSCYEKRQKQARLLCLYHKPHSSFRVLCATAKL